MPVQNLEPYTDAFTIGSQESESAQSAMLLRLHPSLTPAQRDYIFLLCKDLGLSSRVFPEASELVELSGPSAPELRTRFEDLPGVQILDGGEPAELVRGAGSPIGIEVAGARFGAGDVALIAGPCAVEDYDLLLQIARGVRKRGATLLRGGAYKPRTSPYSFQGLGRPGLELLARVREEAGIGVVTEVLDPRDVEAVVEAADVLQVGARSMANFALLKEVGQTRTPVLLKRGFAATLREFTMAAEYVLAGGNPAVILCERGVRGFDNVTRNLLDVGAVAWLKETTHLPVIVDPSHAAGRSDLVPPLARAGIAAGADGLMVEVHPTPFAARSDGQQAVSFETLEKIVADTEALCALDGRRFVHPQITGTEAGPIEETVA